LLVNIIDTYDNVVVADWYEGDANDYHGVTQCYHLKNLVRVTISQT
jgi:hypothetical protein